MIRTRSLTAVAGLLSCVASAAFAAPLTQADGVAPGTAASPPALQLASVCQVLAVSAAYIAVEGPDGVTTLPMTQTAADAFAITHQPGWPATGHIRLIWTPVAGAPAGVLGAVDVGADPVLLDGVPVADAFGGGAQVGTAIQDVALDPAGWPHVVTLQLGGVVTGSRCAGLVAAPATLTIHQAPTDGPQIDSGIGVQPTPAPTPVPGPARLRAH